MMKILIPLISYILNSSIHNDKLRYLYSAFMVIIQPAEA